MQRHAVQRAYEGAISRALAPIGKIHPPAKEIEKKLVVKKMGRKIQKRFDKIVFWVITMPFFVFICVLLTPLYIFGRAKVENEDRLPFDEDSVIVYANHPGLWETILLKRMAFGQSVRHPYRRLAWSTPDPSLGQKWILFRVTVPLLIQRYIFVDRSSVKKKVRALFEIVRTLRTGAWFNLHPEGGRTDSAAEGEPLLTSKNGHKIRYFDDGLASIALRVGLTVVPVGVIGSSDVWPRNKRFPRLHKKCLLKVGRPIKIERIICSNKREFKAKLKEQLPALTKRLEQALLDTLDE